MSKPENSGQILAGQGVPVEVNEYYSTSVRAIDNGYIRTTCEEKDGKYTHKEEFCPTLAAPKTPSGSRSAGSKTLKDAIAKLR